jgi:cobalamin biosynthetic protein CobC
VTGEGVVPAARAPLGQHGGRLSLARALYPSAPTPWIDLSTGINPRPYPAPRASATARARLPAVTLLKELERVAAQMFAVEEPVRVVAVAGTELALRLLPTVLAKSAAAVVGPTYSSHAHAWGLIGATVAEIDVAACDDTARRGGALIVVNPNNPDGRVLDREHMLSLHDALRVSDGVLVVDEAFADATPECSVASLAGSHRAPHLVVLRSFGKFYGLAGVRLGFVIAAPLIAQRLRALIGEWPVSADALVAGLAAYRDTGWAKATRGRLRTEAQCLDALLVRHGFAIVGGTSLFRLARHEASASRFQALLRDGILTRPFDHDCQLLRFGLPRSGPGWRRLQQALEAIP